MKKLTLKSSIICLVVCFGFASIVNAAVPVPYICGESQVYPILEATNNFSEKLFPEDSETQAKMNAAFPRPEAPGSINAFLVFHKGKWVLVDTGLASKGSEIMTTLEQLRLNAYNVDIIVITHNHPDHTGNLVDNFGRDRFPKAHVWISAPEFSAARLGGSNPDPVLSKVAKAYYKRIHKFKDGKEILPGLVARLAPGHTAGHAILQLNDKMLFIGDLIHASRWQFPYPELCTKYDADTEQAVKSRRQFLDLASEKQLVIAGAHIPYPGLGTVNKDGSGYKFFSIDLNTNRAR